MILNGEGIVCVTALRLVSLHLQCLARAMHANMPLYVHVTPIYLQFCLFYFICFSFHFNIFHYRPVFSRSVFKR